jgi:hypothetical protein
MDSAEFEEYLKTRHEPQVICGRTLTFHAMARMCERHIRKDWVIEALREPENPTTTSQLHKHVGPFASVLVNRRTREIVTVSFGRRNDPRKKPTIPRCS